jgi:hypothetical protein
MKDRDPDLVTAAEIASWAWCPESWRLDSPGAEPGNQAARDRGEASHARKAVLEAGSRSAVSLGWWLLAAAAGLLLAALGLVLVRG